MKYRNHQASVWHSTQIITASFCWGNTRMDYDKFGARHRQLFCLRCIKKPPIKKPCNSSPARQNVEQKARSFSMYDTLPIACILHHRMLHTSLHIKLTARIRCCASSYTHIQSISHAAYIEQRSCLLARVLSTCLSVSFA